MKTAILILIAAFAVLAQSEQIVRDPAKRKEIQKTDNRLAYVQERPPMAKSALTIVGDDYLIIWQLVETHANPLTKSEFETGKQFIERLRKILSDTKVPNTDHRLDNCIFIFKVDVPYFAEQQEFRVSIDTAPSPSNGNANDKILFSHWVTSEWQVYQMLPRWQIPMEPSKAQEAKPDLRMAVYGMPLFATGSNNKLAHVLRFVPTKYVLFNQRTGEIYKEQTERDLFF
jgi:hypothetical protein